jgi:hypothetical protein
MHPEPCAKQASSCVTVQMSMRVAGRLMQLERLDRTSLEFQYQGYQRSLPTDIIDIIKRYQQVCLFLSAMNYSQMFYKVGSPFQAQVPSSDGGDSSFAIFSLMLFLFMLSSWRRMRNNNAPEYMAE